MPEITRDMIWDQATALVNSDPTSAAAQQHRAGHFSDLVQSVWEMAQMTDGPIAIIPNEIHHYVVFDDKGWFIEHSVPCRVAGTIGTCEYNEAIRNIADEYDPEQMGRWCITEVDSEGLPSLERTEPA